jgi:hypothetical protein
VEDGQSEIRRRIEVAGEHLRAGDLPGALDVLMPGVAPEQVEEAAAPRAQILSMRVRQVQKTLLGSRPIDPSGSRGLAQTMTVYIRTLSEMQHSPEDASLIADLLSDLQFGNLSRQLPPEARDRLLAALIHAVVQLAPTA